MSISTTLQIIKNKTKNNISYSISRYEDGSWRSLNITGRLTSCSNFRSSEGISYDEAVVSIDCSATIIITNQAQAEAVIERLASIFADRAATGDKNPAVDLKILSNDLKVTNTNILVTKVEKVFVNSNTSLANTSDRINDSLAALRKFSAAKSTITSTTANNLNPQLQAAKHGLSSLVNTVKKSVKTYL